MQKRAVVQDSNNPNNTYSELAGTVEPHALKARGVSRVACTTYQVSVQPGLYSKTLSRKKRETTPPFFLCLNCSKRGLLLPILFETIRSQCLSDLLNQTALEFSGASFCLSLSIKYHCPASGWLCISLFLSHSPGGTGWPACGYMMLEG